MANMKISELAAASSIAGADLIPIVQGGVTKRAPVSLLPTGGGSSTVNGQNLYADNFPASTGLTSVTADGTADDQPKLQAALTYLKTTYGGGTLTLPAAKTMVLASGLTVPSGVRIHGHATSVLKYTPSTGAAITINDGQCTPLSGFKLTGPGASSTATGISITGTRMRYRDLEVRYFYRCVDLVHNDTYIHDFDSCQFGNANTIIWSDVDGKSGSAAATNSGERLVFRGCLLDNSSNAIYASANGSTIFFIGTSIDYVGSFGTFWDVDVHFVGSHLESSSTTVTSGQLFVGSGNPHFFFTSTTIIIGGTGPVTLIKNGPYNYGLGSMRTIDSAMYYTPSTGSAKRTTSKDHVVVPSGSTSITIYSAWITQWNTVSARFVASDTMAQPDLTARITAISAATASITVTFSAATTAQSFLEVSY